MKTRTFDAPLELKALSEKGHFTGYGSVFDVKDHYSDIVVKGAFADTLAKHEKAGRYPPMLWQHDMHEPIGLFTDMAEDDHGLKVEGRLLIDSDPVARRAYAHLDAGSVSGLSIGYIPADEHYDKESGVNNLLAIDLWEVSIVTIPANDAARVGEVKSADGIESIRDLERILRDAGYSRQEAKKVVSRFASKTAYQCDADSVELGNALSLLRRTNINLSVI